MNDKPIDITKLSILAWVLQKQIKNEKGEPLEFQDRAFLLDILTDWSQEICWKKCSQVGGSIIFNVKALFALENFGFNIIYTMPTDGDVEDFVKTKTNPLIVSNSDQFKGVSQDSIHLKQVGDRFMHFKGTISKTAAISTSSDLNIHDEISRSDQTIVSMYKSRLKASKYKATWQFSNPTTSKDILDQKWHLSDQKEWEVTCANGHSEFLRWPDSVDMDTQTYVCWVCKAQISDNQRRRGKWVPQNPGAKVSGYHTSHLMAPWITAGEVIEDSQGDQEYFYNFILGEPYNPGDLEVTQSTVLDNWTPKDLSRGTQWFLGVDVGNIKHFVLGTELGVVKVGKFSDWQVLDDMMGFYKPRLVIDALPDNTMSKYFVKKYPGALMSFFQENFNNPQVVTWWGENDKKGIVFSNKHRGIDQFLDHVLNACMLFGIPADRDLKEFIKHWVTMRRVKVVTPKGIEVYEWDSTTPVNHFFFASYYYYLATLKGGSAVLLGPSSQETTIIDNNNVFQSFGDAIADANPLQY